MSATHARPMSTLLIVPIGLVLAAAAVAVSGGAGTVRAGGDHAVEIVNFAYAPQELTIRVGDTVTWTNLDVVAHTATSTSGAFDSGDLEQGESYSLTFDAAGTYDYLCTPHPSMTGRIIVLEAAPAATPAPPAAGGPAPTAAPATGSGGSLPDVRMEEPRADWMTPAGVGLLALALLIAVAGSARRAFQRRRA